MQLSLVGLFIIVCTYGLHKRQLVNLHKCIQLASSFVFWKLLILKNLVIQIYILKTVNIVDFIPQLRQTLFRPSYYCYNKSYYSSTQITHTVSP
jgi:hypothetical protein